MEYESLNKNIKFSKSSPPIKFVYHKKEDNPENFHLHINEFFEIYIYIDGDADYIMGDLCFTLKRGDIIIINQYETHNVVLKKPCFYERFYILVPIDCFDDFYFNPFKNINKKLISLKASEREKALSVLYNIKDTLKGEEDICSNFRAYGLLLEFLSVVTGQKSERDINNIQCRESRLPKYIQDILVYINKNISQINSAEQIAHKFGLSLPYLSKTFKMNIGTSIKSYIQAKKIAYAKLLLDKDYSVTDACYESGFNDCSYFIKIFKQHIGVTPFKYKNSITK